MLNLNMYCGWADTSRSGCGLESSSTGGGNMTWGCHSSCGAILLSSLDAMLESQEPEQGVCCHQASEGGIDGEREGGIPPPHGITENNGHIITPKTPPLKTQPGEELTRD